MKKTIVLFERHCHSTEKSEAIAGGFNVARASERTRDLLGFIYFSITLPLSHSGYPVTEFG
jgi:hypothetical protein